MLPITAHRGLWVLFASGVIATFVAAQAPSKLSAPSSEVPTVVDPKLQLIGSLSSRHVYTLYGYIGVVADGVAKKPESPVSPEMAERMQAERLLAERMMAEVGVMADQLTTELEGLRKTELTVEDAEAVDEIIAIYRLLKEQAEALRAYARNNTEANGGAFQKKRTEVWPRIAKLLGIPVKSK